MHDQVSPCWDFSNVLSTDVPETQLVASVFAPHYPTEALMECLTQSSGHRRRYHGYLQEQMDKDEETSLQSRRAVMLRGKVHARRHGCQRRCSVSSERKLKRKKNNSEGFWWNLVTQGEQSRIQRFFIQRLTERWSSWRLV